MLRLTLRREFRLCVNFLSSLLVIVERSVVLNVEVMCIIYVSLSV